MICSSQLTARTRFWRSGPYVSILTVLPPIKRSRLTRACSPKGWLAGLVAVGDLWGVNPKEPDAELSLVHGDHNGGIAIAHALHAGGEGARGGSVNKGCYFLCSAQTTFASFIHPLRPNDNPSYSADLSHRSSLP